MTIKEQAFAWFLGCVIAFLLIMTAIFYYNWQESKDYDCPAYKIVSDCDDIVCLDCPEDSYQPQFITQYTCPSEEILRIGKYMELIEVQKETIKTLEEFMKAQQNIINQLR